MSQQSMTDDETNCWIEAGLQCDGVEIDDWTQEAIIKYGRLLTKRQADYIHDMRLQNSAQAAVIEHLNTTIKAYEKLNGKQ